MYICIYVCPWAQKKHHRAKKKLTRPKNFMVFGKKRIGIYSYTVYSTSIYTYIHIYSAFARRTIYTCPSI